MVGFASRADVQKDWNSLGRCIDHTIISSFHPVRKTSVSIKWRPTAIKKYVHSMYQKLELCTNHGASASRIHTKDKRKRNKAAAEVTDWPRMAVKRRLKSKCAKRKARVAKGKKR